MELRTKAQVLDALTAKLAALSERNPYHPTLSRMVSDLRREIERDPHPAFENVPGADD